MLVVFTFSACGFPALNTRGDDNSLLLRLQITDEQVGWASDFPAAADLAIILGTRGDAVVPAFDYENNGNRILPWQWLQSVSEAFYPTEVGDALDLENYYEEWRLVSIRVTPCGPIGITPDQDIDSLCWPAVRLVWQPVIEDMTLAWGVTTPSYADDRAIHAIYPLVPRDEDGHILSTHNRDEVMEHLQLGRSHYSIADSWREQFERERDTTALWLLNRVHDLRDPNLGVGSWNSIQVRAELEGSFESAADFTGKLRALLAEVAVNENLAEMTAFSLPEGRAPASADLWVFV
ncbi:MAG TPA: hypothetical protein DIU15_15785, partial [Deltaproteobacteria bacterium]|nr:hypothetical protein [Deltaproteobacteria bacterium]